MSAPGRKPRRAGFICNPPAACSENNTLCFFHRLVFLLNAGSSPRSYGYSLILKVHSNAIASGKDPVHSGSGMIYYEPSGGLCRLSGPVRGGSGQ